MCTGGGRGEGREALDQYLIRIEEGVLEGKGGAREDLHQYLIRID
jgi:hypothetical protein